MEAATADARAIAAGEQPSWEATFEHPEHGPLTFRVPRLPTNREWLRHGQVQEQIAAGVSGGNAVLAAACAGMHTFIEVPVINEKRDEDPDDPEHVTITRVYYDPLDDEDPAFPVQVWLDWFEWRMALLQTAKEQVKNSSRATSGDNVSDASPASTESPQPTSV